jgi:hypothetical protein
VPQFRDNVQEATNYFFRLTGDTTDVEVQVPEERQVPELQVWGHVSLGVENDAALLRLADQGILPAVAVQNPRGRTVPMR